MNLLWKASSSGFETLHKKHILVHEGSKPFKANIYSASTYALQASNILMGDTVQFWTLESHKLVDRSCYSPKLERMGNNFVLDDALDGMYRCNIALSIIR